MSEIQWNIQQGKLPDDDGYWLVVSGKVQTAEDSSTRMSIEHHYGHRPTEMDAEHLRDEIIETLAPLEQYWEGTNE